MGYPEIENHLPHEVEPLFLTDEEGCPLFVPVVKATYAIDGKGGADGGVSLAQVQEPVNLEGAYWGEPEASSYKYEPEVAFVKAATDVIFIGHAHARKPGVTALKVSLTVGPIQKTVAVFGHRYWYKSMGIATATKPQPFEKIPLIAERAFGGWDRRHPDPAKHRVEPRNPVGIGFHAKRSQLEEGRPLPNIEYPSARMKHYRDTPPPALFGYISPHWQPRAGFAGTYDDAWQRSRMPLLPKDFDRRFFCGAPSDQIAPGFLRGDETVAISNVTMNGRLLFKLPAAPPAVCRVRLRRKPDQHLKTQLDTVIINTDEMRLYLLWRAFLRIPKGFEEVEAVQFD